MALMKKKLLLWFLIYILFCLLIDLLPNFGSPNFRYTGSNPTVHVWNFGWPFASFLYDAESGLHVSPVGVLVVIVQLFVLAVLTAIMAVIRKMWPNRANYRGQLKEVL
jgi:hypothetical protein